MSCIPAGSQSGGYACMSHMAVPCAKGTRSAPDMAQLPSVMADIIMLILKDGACHVGILPNVFFVCPCLPLLMVLQLDEAADPLLVQIQQVFFTAVAAVGSYRLQLIPKRFPVLFQDWNQRIIICPVIAYVSADSQIPRSKLRGIKLAAQQSCGVFDHRGSRQMDMQACPLGSLPAGIK